MQATLLVLSLLPPPSSGSRIFSRLDGAGTTCATDRRITTITQMVVRKIVLAGIGKDLGVRPSHQRIYFKNAAVGIIDFHRSNMTPG